MPEERKGLRGLREPADPNSGIVEGQIKSIEAAGKKPIPLPDALTLGTVIKGLKKQRLGSVGLYSPKWGIFYETSTDPGNRVSDPKTFWQSQKDPSLVIIINHKGRIVGSNIPE